MTGHYERPWGQTAPRYLTPAADPRFAPAFDPAGPPRLDPPPWWAIWGLRQSVWDVLADGSWTIYPQSLFGIIGDDVPLINYALQQAATVRLGNFTYTQNTPLVIPDGTALLASSPSWGIPSGNYGAGPLPLQGSILQATATFTGSQLISMGSAGTTQHGGQRIYGITLNGQNLPAGNTVNGIESQGFVGGVKMRDVVVWGGYNSGTTVGLGGHGLFAHNDGTGGHNPDFWNVDSCKFSACGGFGLEVIAMSDSWFVNGECTGNNLGGGNVQNSGETRFGLWRFNNNATSGATPGLSYTGLGGFTGKIRFDACDCSANGIGVLIAGSGTGHIWLDVTADNNTTQYSYSGTMGVLSPAALNASTATPTFI